LPRIALVVTARVHYHPPSLERPLLKREGVSNLRQMEGSVRNSPIALGAAGECEPTGERVFDQLRESLGTWHGGTIKRACQ